MEFGFKLILVIAITGGVIAYLGDYLGTKIGKKRIRIFGLRPHNSSIVVTVITGVLIASSTIGVSAMLSNSARTALFGMNQLRAELAHLNASVESQNKELMQSRENMKQKSQELKDLTEEVAIQKAQRAAIMGELVSVQEAYDDAHNKLQASAQEIVLLEKTKDDLNRYIQRLENTKKHLESDVRQLREGDVVFRVGEVLSSAVVKPGLKKEDYLAILAQFLHDTNREIVLRMDEAENKNMVFVPHENVKEIADVLAKSDSNMLIRVLAAANIVKGEPAVTTIVTQPYTLIYPKGTLVYKEEITGGSDAEVKVLQFLEKANKKASQDGVLANPLTGKVGSLDGDALYAAILFIRNEHRKVVLEAYTSSDVYTDGPLSIRLKY